MVKEVKLLKLIPIEVLKEKEKTIKVRKRIEYLLNDINEYSTTLYLNLTTYYGAVHVMWLILVLIDGAFV